MASTKVLRNACTLDFNANGRTLKESLALLLDFPCYNTLPCVGCYLPCIKRAEFLQDVRELVGEIVNCFIRKVN